MGQATEVLVELDDVLDEDEVDEEAAAVAEPESELPADALPSDLVDSPAGTAPPRLSVR